MIRKHKSLGGRALLGVLAATSTVVITQHASAQERFFLGAEAAAAGPVTGPQNSEYSTGFAGALSGYQSVVPQLSLGARVGAGVLEEDDDASPAEGTMGFGTLTGAVRIRPFGKRSSDERSTGLWLEAAGGGALLNDQVRAAIEPGLGFNFATDYLGIGPFGRYTQIIETENQYGGEDPRLVLIGLQITPLDRKDQPMRPATAQVDRSAEYERQLAMERERARQREAAWQKERADLEAQRQALVIEKQKTVMVTPPENERVLDERLFFDFDSAELRPEGKEKLKELAESFRQDSGRWQVIRVQGYADQRGSEEYNLRLSGQRASAVREYLLSLGMPQDAIKAEAYGEQWPRIPDASTDPQFQQNRNVSFVVVIGDEAAAANTTKPPAPMIEQGPARPEEAVPVKGSEEGEPEPVPGRDEPTEE